VNLVLEDPTAISPQIGSSCSLEDYLALPDNTMDERIADARAKLGATTILLGHHYQRDEVIRFADATGDSYKLSKIASETDAKYIVFCGVHFMAESADVLGHTGQQVILPDLNAGCSMADMAEISQVEACWEALERLGLADEIVPLTAPPPMRAPLLSGPLPVTGAFSSCLTNIWAAIPAMRWVFRWKRWWFGIRGRLSLGKTWAGRASRISKPAALSCGKATARFTSAFCPATWIRCAPSIPESR